MRSFLLIAGLFLSHQVYAQDDLNQSLQSLYTKLMTLQQTLEKLEPEGPSQEQPGSDVPPAPPPPPGPSQGQPGPAEPSQDVAKAKEILEALKKAYEDNLGAFDLENLAENNALELAKAMQQFIEAVKSQAGEIKTKSDVVEKSASALATFEKTISYREAREYKNRLINIIKLGYQDIMNRFTTSYGSLAYKGGLKLDEPFGKYHVDFLEQASKFLSDTEQALTLKSKIDNDISTLRNLVGFPPMVTKLFEPGKVRKGEVVKPRSQAASSLLLAQQQAVETQLAQEVTKERLEKYIKILHLQTKNLPETYLDHYQRLFHETYKDKFAPKFLQECIRKGTNILNRKSAIEQHPEDYQKTSPRQEIQRDIKNFLSDCPSTQINEFIKFYHTLNEAPKLEQPLPEEEEKSPKDREEFENLEKALLDKIKLIADPASLTLNEKAGIKKSIKKYRRLATQLDEDMNKKITDFDIQLQQ